MVQMYSFLLLFNVAIIASDNNKSKMVTQEMIWLKGGEFIRGGDDPDAHDDEKPKHKVWVKGFWIDKTPVTNAQFKKFVEATGYKTTAERTPTLAELKKQLPPDAPNPPAESLVPGSLVFSKPTFPTYSWHDWWRWTPGAYWRKPLGPASTIEGKDDHPVVHISWDDAQAYARWAGKRLPTEAEWEYAAHGGKNSKYAWGDEEFCDKSPQANIWQGNFPHKSTKPQGYFGTTPVKQYKANGYGLYDMAGNVWQWCSDYYRNDYYKQQAKRSILIDPKGPSKSHDPLEPFAQKRVIKGGSFLCHKTYCKRYRISARMRTTQDTSLNHLGFRCAKS